MYDLFTIIPPQFFQPLAAPGASVYAEILLALLAEAQRQPEPLSRDLAINVIYPLLADPVYSDLTQDAAEAPAGLNVAEPADKVQAQATAVLRYLERCGWLRAETLADFTQTYIFPDYAFRLLHALGEIAASQPPPLAGLICSIHDLLQAAAAEGNVEVRLPEAHRQTEQLVNGLKELQHNIGLHINQVLREMPAREVLAAFFSTYQTEIVDRAYHQLRTTDHISRFRPGVLAVAGQLEQAGSLAAPSAPTPTAEAATPTLRLRRQLRFVREQFEDLDGRLQAIDVRHSRYVSAAVRAVELQLEAHSTTSGQLASILTTLLHDKADETWAEAEAMVQLHRLELPTAESLSAPTRAAQPFVAAPEPASAPTEAELVLARTATAKQLNRAVSREKIRRLAQALLRDRPEARATDLLLTNADDLPLLIYLRAYGDGTLGYRVEALDDWVQRGEFAFRDFRLLRAPVEP